MLVADTRKGTRPGFSAAAPSEAAGPVVQRLRALLHVDDGLLAVVLDT